MGRTGKRSRKDATSSSRAASLVLHTPSPEPLPVDDDTRPLDIEFVDDDQRQRFQVLSKRHLYNTRFADDVAMNELGVLSGVQQLFTNIGWQGLLKWDEVGYKRTTLEFLSSVRFQENEMHFRLFNKPCTLTMRQISNLIRAPTQDTFTPLTPTPPEYRASAFWYSITRETPWKISNAKASQIVHPTLRVAHRLLSCILSFRLDAGGVNQQELFLLWCMVNPRASRPDFSSYLCQKLKQISSAKSGNIYCGSVITILSRHKSLRLPSLEGLQELRGPRYLGMTLMEKMQLFKILRDGSQVWLKGTNHVEYLRIRKSTHEFLYLADPIEATDWLLTDFEGASSQSADEATEEPIPALEAPISVQLPRDHHDEYMARFTAIDTELTTIRTTVGHVQRDLAEMGRSLSSIHGILLGRSAVPPPPPHE